MSYSTVSHAPTTELSPLRKFEYLREKLAILATEVRAVTGQPWVISADLFSGERNGDMTGAAEAAGLSRNEWDGEKAGGYYIWNDDSRAVEITIHDGTMPHVATEPAS